ncbi:hypothetical protein AYO48_02165 [Gaiella sp. SCGC AG-212-M14]|nr:hypothetical protein AYO48_02165 [Gaiella sp. SCGC AG-212-M14]
MCAGWRGTDGKLGAGGRTHGTRAGEEELDGGALRPAPDRSHLQARRDAGADPVRDLRGRRRLETAIPQIRAYLVGVEPDHRVEVLAALQSYSVVAGASKEPIAEAFDTSPDDTDWPQQAGLRVAGFPKAWDVTQGSSKIVVAVIDTGVDAKHPDLRGALVPGWDFVGNAPIPRTTTGTAPPSRA